MLGIQTKQDKKLNYYKEQLEQIKKDYSNSKLKVEHKVRLDEFIDRAINYCKTQKAVIYQRADKYYKNENYNKVQKGIYKKVLMEVVKIQKQILDDDELKIKHKQQLCRCLSYVVGHLRGRIHSSSL